MRKTAPNTRIPAPISGWYVRVNRTASESGGSVGDLVAGPWERDRFPAVLTARRWGRGRLRAARSRSTVTSVRGGGSERVCAGHLELTADHPLVVGHRFDRAAGEAAVEHEHAGSRSAVRDFLAE